MKKLILLALMTSSLTFAATTSSIDKAIEKNAEKITELTEKGLNTTYGDSKEAVSSVYGDMKNAAETVYTDAKSTFPEIKQALVYLAEGLKTTADAVWDILVRQQLVYSIVYLFLFLSSIFLWYQFRKAFKVMNTDLDDSNYIKHQNIFIVLLLGIFAFTDSIIAGTHMVEMVTGFVNPEYGALKTIIEIASTLKQ